MELKVTHANVWEPMGGALQLCAVYRNRIFTVITRESVSSTASHSHCVRTCNEIEGLYDTSTKLYRKNIAQSLPLALLLVLCTCNNTNGNELMIQLCTMVILVQYRKYT